MSINPFERKFREFAQNLTKKNAEGHADVIGTKSGEVFKDKPFTEEYAGVYKISQVGQSLAQVVTFTTTAALGVFALQHVIPLAWGIYIAIPLGLLFAFGIEKVKRSTLAIAAKHWLKYKTFGFVGIVAVLTLCVSIAAALYGAKELPGVVYPKPARAVDGAAVAALTADIDRVQADIDRLQGNLKSGKNWIAENKTLPKLQAQRLALIEKRDAANGSAEWRADAQMTDALIDRQEKVDKMQVYAVGAAIIAELIFALCTAFVFYYYWRAFVEVNAENEGNQDAPQAPGIRIDTHTPATMNGKAVAQNFRADADKITHTTQTVHAHADGKRATQNEAPTIPLQTHLPDGQRLCDHCGTAYICGHARQRFCTEKCRIESWQNKNGKEIRHRINAK
jgi:hypothetical protein